MASAKVGSRIAVIVLSSLALVAIDQPTGWAVLAIAALVLVAPALIEFVGRRTAPRTT